MPDCITFSATTTTYASNLCEDRLTTIIELHLAQRAASSYDQLNYHESTEGYKGKMSGKYAFSQTLKEVRFLFCQTAEHSSPTR